MRYRVHRLDIKMTTGQLALAQFLETLEGEVVAIVPNTTILFPWYVGVDFLLIVEKLVPTVTDASTPPAP